MKRQRVRREFERICDLAGRQTFRPGLNQQPEHREAMLLRKSGQSRDGIGVFHISTIIEI
jgi:hypothetical protein